ncbi:Ribosomal protein L32e [mine drainage metagenome]|uniref:Ribosomal protein L32e n=1 Tax=mine drainage metagenome TaxID=410659 RepID=T1CIH7_9ZZZZ
MSVIVLALKKKTHPKFNVPNYGTKNRKRVKDSWRKQRGIDNKKRIKKNFMGAEPTIGYRNSEQLRGIRQSGMRLMVVHSMSELNGVVENPDVDASKYEFAMAHGVSKRVRAEMLKFAKEQNLHIVNGASK